MNKYIRQKVVQVMVIGMLLPANSYGKGFFDERYRGWFWFEEPQESGTNNDLTSNSNIITPKAAREEIDQMAEDLEAAKYVMLARPTPANVKAYRDEESKMWKRAMILHDSWDMANLLYPQQRDLVNNPVNVHAVRMKRSEDAKVLETSIKEFAGKFDLVLFFAGGCQYCLSFTPVLENFAQKYGFNVEAVSMDGSSHKLFKTAQVPELVKKLAIDAAPTVVAISKDSKTAFELIRGYVTLSELEEYSALAIKYLQEEGKW